MLTVAIGNPINSPKQVISLIGGMIPIQMIILDLEGSIARLDYLKFICTYLYTVCIVSLSLSLSLLMVHFFSIQ